jgi:hypothetical protein
MICKRVSAGTAAREAAAPFPADDARPFRAGAGDFAEGFAGAGFFCADARAAANESAATAASVSGSIARTLNGARGADLRRTSFECRVFGMGLSGANSRGLDFVDNPRRACAQFQGKTTRYAMKA